MIWKIEVYLCRPILTVPTMPPKMIIFDQNLRLSTEIYETVLNLRIEMKHPRCRSSTSSPVIIAGTHDMDFISNLLL
jgi:hypothetical protein